MPVDSESDELSLRRLNSYRDDIAQSGIFTIQSCSRAGDIDVLIATAGENLSAYTRRLFDLRFSSAFTSTGRTFGPFCIKKSVSNVDFSPE